MNLAVFCPETGRCTHLFTSGLLEDHIRTLATLVPMGSDTRVLDGTSWSACQNPEFIPNISEFEGVVSIVDLYKSILMQI